MFCKSDVSMGNNSTLSSAIYSISISEFILFLNQINFENQDFLITGYSFLSKTQNLSTK